MNVSWHFSKHAEVLVYLLHGGNPLFVRHWSVHIEIPDEVDEDKFCWDAVDLVHQMRMGESIRVLITPLAPVALGLGLKRCLSLRERRFDQIDTRRRFRVMSPIS